VLGQLVPAVPTRLAAVSVVGGYLNVVFINLASAESRNMAMNTFE